MVSRAYLCLPQTGEHSEAPSQASPLSTEYLKIFPSPQRVVISEQEDKTSAIGGGRCVESRANFVAGQGVQARGCRQVGAGKWVQAGGCRQKGCRQGVAGRLVLEGLQGGSSRVQAGWCGKVLGGTLPG